MYRYDLPASDVPDPSQSVPYIPTDLPAFFSRDPLCVRPTPTCTSTHRRRRRQLGTSVITQDRTCFPRTQRLGRVASQYRRRRDLIQHTRRSRRVREHDEPWQSSGILRRTGFEEFTAAEHDLVRLYLARLTSPPPRRWQQDDVLHRRQRHPCRHPSFPSTSDPARSDPSSPLTELRGWGCLEQQYLCKADQRRPFELEQREQEC